MAKTLHSVVHVDVATGTEWGGEWTPCEPMNAMQLIQAELAKPITRNVVVTRPDGSIHTIPCRSVEAANNEAKAKRRFAGVTVEVSREAAEA